MNNKLIINYPILAITVKPQTLDGQPKAQKTHIIA